jgi:hypothetical protein
VGQVHELQAEDPVRSGWPVNPVTLVLVVLGALLGAVALSALFAHPAGASTVPGTSGAPTVGAVSNAVRPAVAAVKAVDALTDVVAPQDATPGSDPAAGPDAALSPAVTPLPVVTLLPIVTLLHAPGSAFPGLAPVIAPISQAAAPPLGLVVTTLTSVPTLISVPTPALGTTLPFAQPALPSSGVVVADATSTRLGTTAGPLGGPPAFGLRAGLAAPHPAPVPVWPLQSFPLFTNGSPTGDSSLSSAGTALVAAPASGPLLPDPPVSGVIPAQSGIPRFLFDLRSSPPG